MSRLFVDGQRFDPLSSTALYEHEYEALILQYAKSLFPGLITTPFTKTVYHDGVGHGADLAVIDPRYVCWWVVEVELAHHSLEGHVLPQVATLAQAPYGDAEAKWLAARNPDLSLTSLTQMMLGSPPQVIVVVNAMLTEWVTHLRPWARLMTVELFRSSRGRLILRQDGAELAVPGDELTRCHVDPAMPRMLVIESPAPILARGEDLLEIDYAQALTRWHVIRSADRVWLSPSRGSLFPEARYLRLVALPEDRLGFVQDESPHRRPLRP